MNRIILYDRPSINGQLNFHVIDFNPIKIDSIDDFYRIKISFSYIHEIISLFEKEDLLGLAIYL